MKLTKTKSVETITEEIEIKEGVYYFSRGYIGEEPYEYFRVDISNRTKINNTHVDLIVEKVRDTYDDYMISYKEDYTDYLGNIVEAYFLNAQFLEDEIFLQSDEKTFFAVKERIKQKL